MNFGIKNVLFKRKLFHSPVKYFSFKKHVGCSSFIISFKNKSISSHENMDALLVEVLKL